MTVSLDAKVWLRRFHPAPSARTRLVCFPHAGGSASWFHPVSAALSPSVEVLAVQYPGRQDRRGEPLVDDLFVLADQLADVLAPEPGPLAFFGHSMGASLAFEVARRLEPRGTHLLSLFVSGRRAPSTSVSSDEPVHQKDDAGLLAEVRQLSGTDSQVLADAEIVQLVLPSLRNDYKAAETYHYRPGPDVSCPIVALLGEDDPKVTEAEARQWAAYTSGAFELKTFPGGHFYLAEHHAAVNRLLGARLTGQQ
jgi:pyochelin biosynthetic protein PchC